MSETGYEVLHIDELESFPLPNQDGLTWRPIRRRFDIRGFGVNAYTAEQAGLRVVEEHREGSGHQELYVVIAGRATFTLDGEEHDAPAGTLVFVKPGTLRSAFAAEPGTTVLGVGAKRARFSSLRPGNGASRRSGTSSGATRNGLAPSSRRESPRAPTPGRATTITPVSRPARATRKMPYGSSSAPRRSIPSKSRRSRPGTRTSSLCATIPAF